MEKSTSTSQKSKNENINTTLSNLTSMLKDLQTSNLKNLVETFQKKTTSTQSTTDKKNTNTKNSGNDSSNIKAEDVMSHVSAMMGGHKLSEYGMNAMKNHTGAINDLCDEFINETENGEEEENDNENEEQLQRDPEMIYQLFNKQITERFIPLLAREIPQDAHYYKNIVLKIVEMQIFKDFKNPMKKWKETTKDHKHCLQTLNQENLAYFVENVEKIEILQDLKVGQNWETFSKKLSNIQELWAIFAELLRLESLVDVISPNLLSALETTMKTITEKGDLVRSLHQRGDTQQLYNVALHAIMGDKGVLNEVKKYTKLVKKNISGNGPSLPPSLQELQKLETEKNEELNK